MKQKMTYLCGLAATLLLATACQNEDTPAGPETQTASATFHIQTRAGDGTHQTALYIAERKKESDQDELYCSDRQDINGETYTLTDMTAQWYKLAFISVPNKVILPDILADSAFNDLLLDYSPVLNNQNQGVDDDLAIYRVIKDRWLMPGETLTENAVLTRITGQLVLNMGILNDQFAGQVTEIEVTLTDVPYRVYLRDNANGKIIYPEAEGTASQDEGDDTPQPEEPITYERKDFTYTFPIAQTQWESRKNFKMYFNLLPFTVTGSTDENKTVSGCQVTITRCEDNQIVPTDGSTPTLVAETYPLIDGTSGSIGIQANTRTTLRFNGLEDNEFVVRYDKFGDDSNGIGVADDEWNGWNPPATGGDSSGNGNDQQQP